MRTPISRAIGLGLLSTSPALAANTLYVGPSDAYTNIASAVAASAAGDTIVLRAGTYAEDLDLRGHSLTIEGESGPVRTIISAPSAVRLNGATTVRGVSFSPAPATGVYIDGGTVLLEDVQVHDAPSDGVVMLGGATTVVETAVFGSGRHNFAVTGGTATLTRSLSWYPTEDGFLLQSASVVQNCAAIGGYNGFRAQNATLTMSNNAALANAWAGVNAYYDVTISNGVFLDDSYIDGCNNGATPSFDHGVGTRNYASYACTGAPHTAITDADPLFTAWSDRLPLAYVDLRPGAGSPMIDAGTGLDTDGSTGDVGVFGGPSGGWSNHDGDGQVNLFDCDDHDANTYLGAPERADGRDNDCDGSIDEDVVVDTGDTGDTSDTGGDTGSPPGTDIDGDGWVSSVDCDEHNIATHPYAPEIIDRADNNCDGAADEGTIYGDDDHDGFSEVGGDCDDTDPERSPGAADDVYNALDNDCDGQEDTPHGVDHDGDGYRDDELDCDDSDAIVHPGAADGRDGADSDCDGVTDDDAITVDADGDGVTPQNGDCQDDDPTIYTGAVDIADNFIDEDCSGSDNYDADRDGDPSTAAGGTDCDDLDNTVAPGKAELCDAQDNDCDGEIDEGCDESDDPPSEDPGCGCAATPGDSALAPLLAVLAVAASRRRRAAR